MTVIKGPTSAAEFAVWRAAEGDRREARRVRHMTTELLGFSGAAFLPRLLLLWLVILPLLLLRAAAVLLVGMIFFGGTWTMVAMTATPATAVGVQAYYRDFLAWAEDNDTFQKVWDTAAHIIALCINILVYMFRLLLELWNGFCPLLALMIDIVYEVCRQLVVIFFGNPILQYMVMWIVRLVVLVLETWIDSMVGILEAFGQFAEDMTVGVGTKLAEEGEEVFGRRLLAGEEVYVPVGEILLHIAVAFITFYLRIQEAVYVAFLPLISSFVQFVLPKLLKYIPPFASIIVQIFSLFASEPVRRILLYWLEAMPILLELLQAIICGWVTYIAPMYCYMAYAFTVVLSFFLKYVVRPVVCTSNAFLGGCSKSFIYAAFAGHECFECGDFSTACGCKKYARPVDSSNCDSQCVSPDDTPVTTRPPATPNTGNRSYSNNNEGDQFSDFIRDPSTYDDLRIAPQSGADDTASVGLDGVSSSIVKDGVNWEDCDRDADPTCDNGGSVTTTTYSLDTPQSRRRRTAVFDNSTLPPPIATAPSPSPGDPTSAPTVAPTPWPTTVDPSVRRRTIVAQTTTDPGKTVLVSAGGVYTSSPGMYAPLVAQFVGSEAIYRLGTLAHRSQSGVVCVGGIGCGDELTTEAVSDLVTATAFDTNLSVGLIWPFAEWRTTSWLRVDLARPANVLRVDVTWVNVQDILAAPSSYTMEMTSVTGEHRSYSQTGSCIHTGTDRADTLSTLGSTVNLTRWVRLVVNRTSACSSLGDIENAYESRLQLRSVLLWGTRNTSLASAVGGQHLRTTHAVSARTNFRGTGIQYWDPCASGYPQRISDGLRGLPVIMWPDTPTSAPTWAPTHSPTSAGTGAPTTTAPTGAPTTIAPTGAPTTAAPTGAPTGTTAPTTGPTSSAPTFAPTTAAPTPAPTQATSMAQFNLWTYNESGYQSVDVTRLVVHLAPGAYLQPTDAYACRGVPTNLTWSEITGVLSTAGRCVAADSDQWYTNETGFTWEGVTGLRQRYGNLTQSIIDSGFTSAVFWDTDYVEKAAFPVRGHSLSFDFQGIVTTNASDHLVADADVSVIFGPTAFTRARATTWDTVLIENKLHTAYTVAASWRLAIEAELMVGGRVTDPTLSHHVYCQEELAAIDLPVAGSEAPGVYTAPFGGGERPWIGITEIDVFGDVIDTATPTSAPTSAPTSSRRLLSVHGVAVHGVEDQLSDEQAEQRAALLSRAREQDRQQRGHEYSDSHSVKRVMLARGLRSGTSASSASRTVDGDRARRRLEGTSADTNSHPFHPLLSLVPDVTEEASMKCSRHFDHTETERMRCYALEPRSIGFEESVGETIVHGETEPVSKGLHQLLSDHNPVALRRLRNQLIDLPTEVQRAETRRAALARGTIYGVTSASRSLQGSGGHPLDPRDTWDSIKDKVEELAKQLIREFEIAVTVAIGCSNYCEPHFGCNDDTRLGQCLPASVQFIASKMFMCDEGQNLYDCTIGRVLDFVWNLFLLFVDWCFSVIDSIGEFIGNLLGLGDLLKIIACQACAITTMAVGLLSDFLDDFPLSRCTNILEKGTNQCDKWGMGNIAEVGAAIFGSLLPLLKILFGLAQVMPALAEVVVKTALMVLGGMFDIFPELIEDSYEILIWLFASGELVDTLEVLFEAFQDTFEEIQNKNLQISSNAATTNYGSVANESVWTKDTDAPIITYEEEELAVGECYAADADAGRTCGESSLNNTLQQRNAIYNDTRDGRPGFAAIAAGDDGNMEFSLDNCGCSVPHRSCEDGAGTGNCKFQNSVAQQSRAENIRLMQEQATTGSAEDRSTWPQCAAVSKRIVRPDLHGVYHNESPELEKIFIASKRCYVERRIKPAGRDMTIDSTRATAKSKQSGTNDIAAWWPFRQFSKQDGTPTTDADKDIDKAQFPDESLHYPSRSQVSGRRRAPAVQQRRSLAEGVPFSTGHRRLQSLFTVQPIHPDHGDAADATLSAAREVRKILIESNTSYAEQQYLELRRLIRQAGEASTDVLTQVNLPSLEPVRHNLKATLSVGRRLLGLSDIDEGLESVACGFTQLPGSYPNTYPCAKHLWCGIKSPIRRDWHFDKKLIAWHPEWVDNSKCPELDTYAEAYKTLLRSTLKAGRSLVDRDITVWPFDHMAASMWSFTGFEDDEWPAVKRHGEDVGYQLQILCFLLNMGVFIPLVVGLIFVIYTLSIWQSTMIATAVICKQTFIRPSIYEL